MCEENSVVDMLCITNFLPYRPHPQSRSFHNRKKVKVTIQELIHIYCISCRFRDHVPVNDIPNKRTRKL